jgi:hypothetical protein
MTPFQPVFVLPVTFVSVLAVLWSSGRVGLLAGPLLAYLMLRTLVGVQPIRVTHDLESKRLEIRRGGRFYLPLDLIDVVAVTAVSVEVRRRRRSFRLDQDECRVVIESVAGQLDELPWMNDAKACRLLASSIAAATKRPLYPRITIVAPTGTTATA